MNAVAIVGCTIAGGVVGGLVGAFSVEGPDDLGFGAMINGGVGMIVGGLLGCVAGAAIFA